jgi:hypothetical protein
MVHERVIPPVATPFIDRQSSLTAVAGVARLDRRVHLADIILPEFNSYMRIDNATAVVLNAPSIYYIVFGQNF